MIKWKKEIIYVSIEIKIMHKVHLEEPSLLVIIGTLEGGADLPGRSCLYMQTVDP